MVSLYQKLLQICSFKEFWDATRYSGMIALFDKYGFGSNRKSFRYFQSVMENNKLVPSAWYLKSFVYDKTRTDLPRSLRAVTIDYGFDHCRDATDRTRLRQAYRSVFDQSADELLLHEACVTGHLFEFCSPFFPAWTSADKEYFQTLMVNPYPLISPVSLAGLVAENVMSCKKSDEEFFRRKLAAEARDDYVLFAVDDTHESEILRIMGELNSHRLEGSLQRVEGSPQRLEGHDIGEVQLSL